MNPTQPDLTIDVAIVGGGGAGLSLLVHLDHLLRSAHPAAAAGPGRAPRIAVVDPVTRAGADRTWCFWDAGPGSIESRAVEPCVQATWRRIAVVDPSGESRVLDLDPLRYVMVGSAGFYDLAAEAARRLAVTWVRSAATSVHDGADRALVTTADGQRIAATWVFDSSPAAPSRASRTELLQHFRGWTIRLPQPLIEPDVAVLMDFAVPQPAGRGLAFSYLLPLAADRALVEYTEFSRCRLAPADYDAALRADLVRRWPGHAGEITVEATEDGAIPMTDAAFAPRAGRRVFRIGTSGGATRGSSGYTFAAMQRQAAAVTGALTRGDVPLPPAPYPARHRWMDAVMLRALDRGLVDGPDLYLRLFDRNPAHRLLRFLDGATSRPEDLAVMRTAPLPAMLRAAAGDAAVRLRRRAPRPGSVGGPHDVH